MHLLDVFGQLASFGLEKYKHTFAVKFHKIDLFFYVYILLFNDNNGIEIKLC